MSSDPTLVLNLRGPDAQQAARSSSRSYGGELYGFALAAPAREGLAEELVQDVFTRA